LILRIFIFGTTFLIGLVPYNFLYSDHSEERIYFSSRPLSSKAFLFTEADGGNTLLSSKVSSSLKKKKRKNKHSIEDYFSSYYFPLIEASDFLEAFLYFISQGSFLLTPFGFSFFNIPTQES
jgi:hypothetical protein